MATVHSIAAEAARPQGKWAFYFLGLWAYAILTAAPAAALNSANPDSEAAKRIQAQRQRITDHGKKAYDEMVERSKKGEDVEAGGFDKFLDAEAQNAGPWIGALAREIARNGGGDEGRLRTRLWQSYLERFANDPDGYRNLGESLASQEEFGRAIAAFTNAINLGDSRPGNFYQRGLAAERVGDYELAHRDAGMALALDPGERTADALYRLTDARVSKIRVNLETGALEPPSSGGSRRAPPAGSSPVPTEAHGPPEPPAAPDPILESARLTRAAQWHLQMKDAQAAIVAAEQATRLNPRNAQAFNLLATAHERSGNHKAAISNANATLAIQPDSVPALNTRSWASSGLGLFQKALTDAGRVIELDPFNAFGFVNKARAMGGLGSRTGMIDALSQAARLDPRFDPLHERALQLPQSDDTELLFAGVLGRDQRPTTRRSQTNRRFLTVLLSCLSGGVLVALGLLHVISPAFRERVQNTLRGLRREKPANRDVAPLAGYEIVRVIATGGMGVVYEAIDRKLARRVAVKKLRGEIRDDAKERERFMKEARTVAALRHPHIVQIHSIIEEGADIYLVFEYIEGRTLRELLAQRRSLPWKEAMKIFGDVCGALEYAHAHDVVHRDLKPSNIMVDSDGRALVMDFGVARTVKDAVSRSAVTNTVWGTPSYMAPEAEEGAIRTESDLYSLGVCLYELVTGNLPFNGSPVAMYKTKSEGSYSAPRSLNPGLPPGLDEVIALALAPDPRRRWKNVKEFWEAVTRL